MNRTPEVDRWLDESGHPLEAAMRRAREIILGADERVTESIKWKTPTFAFDLGEVEAGRADLEAVVRAWCDWKAGAA
jgi:hypothetical protein